MIYAVIPTLNPGEQFAPLLQDLQSADLRIVVTDGGSEGAAINAALKYGARIVSGHKGRGHQLARGADYSGAGNSDWFLFVHADSVLPKNWHGLLTRHIEKTPNKAACFGFHLDDKGMWPRFVEFWVWLRTIAMDMPYGDQGLFIRKDLYDAVGGYDREPLFEDVAIIKRIQGRRLVKLRGNITTDAAKYRRDGYRKRTFSNLKLAIAYSKGASAQELAEKYR